MKTSNEYRAEGFRNWWRFAKESSLIALMQVIGYFVYVSATIIVDKYFPGNGTEDLMWKFGKTLVLLGTIGLLSYYVPVWFLNLWHACLS